MRQCKGWHDANIKRTTDNSLRCCTSICTTVASTKLKPTNHLAVRWSWATSWNGNCAPSKHLHKLDETSSIRHTPPEPYIPITCSTPARFSMLRAADTHFGSAEPIYLTANGAKRFNCSFGHTLAQTCLTVKQYLDSVDCLRTEKKWNQQEFEGWKNSFQILQISTCVQGESKNVVIV